MVDLVAARLALEFLLAIEFEVVSPAFGSIVDVDREHCPGNLA